ncbi:MAG TPA: histidine kinase [Microbacteriaceae bacterium]
MKSLSRGQWFFDAALAAVFVVIGQYELRFLPESGYQDGPLALNTVLTFLSAAPLLVRRRWPLTALTMAAAPLIFASLITVHAMMFWGTAVPLAVLCYSVARWSQRQHAAWLAFGTSVVMIATYPIHSPTFTTVEDYAFGGVLFGVAVAAGAVISQLTRQRLALDAAMVRLREHEHDRRMQVLADERARIAREMHDVMAHGVSVMVVQAGSARLELAPDASKARESLLVVEQTGRDVLTELRHTVGLLRNHESAAGGEPAPNLAALPALAQSMKAAGLDVSLNVEDHLDLDPGRALAVYRVIQEALTNALRHSGPGRVQVSVTRPDDLQIEVVNSCARAASTASRGGGNGLPGMRERVGMFDGDLVAGPEPDGFAVRARIPMDQRQ